MRVLFTTTPGRGHYQPMLPLARELASAGHEVRWAAAEEVCVRLRERGFDATDCGVGHLEASPLAPPPPEIAALPVTERPNFLFSQIFGPRRAAPMLRELVPIVEAWRPQLMICDQAELAGPIAAKLAEVPNVTHGFGRLLPRERVARARESMRGLWEEHGLEPPEFAGTYEHLYLDIYPPSLQTAEVAHVGERQLVRPADVPRAEPNEPFVYITFGTVFNDDLSVFETAVAAARELPIEVVVTLGPGNDPAALGEQPANVRVATYIPQEELLPLCSAVVSHAGSGTFLAAVAAGVPQLLVPLAADQFDNAKAAEAGGVGRVLWPGDVTVTKSREALAGVLADGAMRAAAERIGDEIAAMPPPEAVVGELERRFG